MTTAEANINKELFLKAKELGITTTSSHFWSTAVAYGRSVGLPRQQAAQALVATAIQMKHRESSETPYDNCCPGCGEYLFNSGECYECEETQI